MLKYKLKLLWGKLFKRKSKPDLFIYENDE